MRSLPSLKCSRCYKQYCQRKWRWYASLRHLHDLLIKIGRGCRSCGTTRVELQDESVQRARDYTVWGIYSPSTTLQRTGSAISSHRLHSSGASRKSAVSVCPPLPRYLPPPTNQDSPRLSCLLRPRVVHLPRRYQRRMGENGGRNRRYCLGTAHQPCPCTSA